MKLSEQQQSVVEQHLAMAHDIAARIGKGDDEYVSIAELALCEAVATLPPGLRSIKSWLARVIINDCKEYRRAADQQTVALPVAFDKPAPAAPPDAHVNVLATIAQLPAERRAEVHAMIVDGLRVSEGAALFGVHRTCLYERVRRACRSLKGRLILAA